MTGAEQIKQFQDAGFTPEEIQQWSSDQAQRLGAAGFKQEEIGAWFGQKPEPDHAKANEALAKSVTTITGNAKQTASDIATLYGPVEMGLNAATGFAFGFPMYLGAGGATAAMRAAGLLSPDTDPKEIATRFSQAVTYQPMSQPGQRLSEALMLPLTDLTATGEKTGHKVTDITGSPLLGSLTEATIEMLPAPFLGALGRRLATKVPTSESIRDTATSLARSTDEPAVEHIDGKLRDVYEKTGVDPQAVFEEARRDPTIVQDLASQNVEVPKAITDAAGIPEKGTVRADLAESAGFWEGPKVTDIEFTQDVPTKAEKAEAFLEGRKWYASDSETAKDVLAKGQAGVETGKTPEAALGEALPPPPPEPPKPAGAGEGPPRSDAEKTILSKIVQENEPFYVTLKNLVLQPRRTLSKLYTEGIDRLNPIKVAEREAGGPAKFAEGVGPYEAQRLTAGTFGRGALFLEYGPRKFGDLTKKVAPSLFETLDSVKDDPRGFEAYIVSKHAIEVEGRGMKSGFDLEAAKQVVKGGEAKFQPALDNWVKYGDALLDYLVDSGLVGKEGAAAMRESYKSYVPFYRSFEEQARPMTGQPRNPIKRMKGSERDTVDPIISRIKDTFLFLALAEKNAARQKMVQLGPEFTKPVMQKVAAEPARTVAEYEKQLETFLESGDVEKAPEQLSAFKPSSYQTGPNQIVVFENGVRRIYEVDPEVARAFNATDSASASILASMLRASASLLRAGVTLAPEFSPRNFARDAITAFVYAGSHPIKTVKGAVSLWKGDEAFQRWMAGGGANAAMVSMDRAYINKEIFRLNEQTGFMGSAWNIAKTPIETLRIASEFMENMTRLGAVRDEMLQAKTAAKIQALSLISREATVDFARHGADPFLQKWSTATAFMNPQIQGIDVMFRKMAENPTGTTARALGAITLPSLYLWWANHDDFRWKDVPNWERDLFWVAFHGHKTQAQWDAMSQPEKDKFLQENRTDRVPKPFELGVLFGSVPERILDAYVDEKPDAFKQFGKTMLNVFGFNVIPTAAVPPLEHMTNRSFFTDRPLIPNSMEKILPEYQYTPYTTQTTRALGHIVGTLPNMHDSSFASPVVIDNYIRGWSGTLGTYAVQIADAALRKTGVLPDPVRPASTLADIPVIKAFVIRYPSAQAQTIQDFHDRYAKAQMVTQTVHHLAMQGDAEAAIREAQMDPAALARLDGIQTGLANAQRMIQMVDRNPNMKADEKRQIIDSTYLQMIQMATAGNAAMLTLEKGMKARPIIAPASETVH